MDDGADGEELPGDPRLTQLGCGCTLPFSGLILVSLTSLLAVLVASRTDGLSPLWLVLFPLVLGIVALFVRVSRR